MRNKAYTNSLSNSRGIITVDFLFAFILVMGFSALMFAITITLTVVEITQYITFASARTFNAGHINIAKQRRLSQKKYLELREHPEFAPFYKNGWFEIDEMIEPSDFGETYNSSSKSSDFTGVRVNLLAKMLNFEIPFYGSVISSERKDAGGFSTYIASFLGRQPTTNECILNFTVNRWKSIKELDERYTSKVAFRDEFYFTITDNGC